MERELWDSYLSVYLLDFFTLELETGSGGKRAGQVNASFPPLMHQDILDHIKNGSVSAESCKMSVLVSLGVS